MGSNHLPSGRRTCLRFRRTRQASRWVHQPGMRANLPPVNVWLKTLLSLVGVWLLAFGAIHWLHASKPTAASITAYLKRTDLTAMSPGDRARALARAADQLNELSFDERQRLQRSGETRRFFATLTPAEQDQFLDATLPSDFKQLMEVFNKMEPAKRKEFVDHALEDMKKHEGEAPPVEADERVRDRVIDQGLKSFYKDANSDVKLDLAPLIEQMQRNLQGGGPG